MMKSHPLLKDKEWLKDQYLNQGKSEYQIADEINASRSAVFRWRKTHKIPSKKEFEK